MQTLRKAEGGPLLVYAPLRHRPLAQNSALHQMRRKAERLCRAVHPQAGCRHPNYKLSPENGMSTELPVEKERHGPVLILDQRSPGGVAIKPGTI